MGETRREAERFAGAPGPLPPRPLIPYTSFVARPWRPVPLATKTHRHPPPSAQRTAQERDETQRNATPNPALLSDLRREAMDWADRACSAPDDDAPDGPADGGALAEPGGTLSASLPPSSSKVGTQTLVSDYRPPWERDYLAALAIDREFVMAADAAGINESTAWRHRQRSPRFARLCAEARERSTSIVRREVFTRGVVGWYEPVFFAREKVGDILRKSDRMLELEAKRRDASYRDRVDLTHSAPDGGPIRTASEVTVQLQPYESAIAMMVAGVVAREIIQRPALPAPAGPEVIDVKPVGGCPRCDGPGTNPYCPVCHGGAA